MKVLVTTVDLQQAGGVASYFGALRPYLSGDIEYLTIGSRPGRESRIGAVRRMVGDYRRFCRALATGEHDLVHLNPSLGEKAVVRDGLNLLAAKRHGKKVLVFFRGWDLAVERSIRRHFLPLFRRVYFRADAVIVLAEEFREKLREMGYEGPIFVETTVVSDDAFGDAPGDATPRGHQGRDGPFHVLYLSRLDRGKGAEEALEACRILQARHPAVRLTMAGDGPVLDALKASAQRMPGVDFPGYLVGAAKERAYRAADVYFFPSNYGEGMPNSVLEAMAHGLPVITRPVGGLKDFFEDGAMGFMTPSLDPGELADLLERLLLDPALRARMGAYNRDYASRRFRASIVASRLLAIYASLASGAPDSAPVRDPAFR